MDAALDRVRWRAHTTFDLLETERGLLFRHFAVPQDLTRFAWAWHDPRSSKSHISCRQVSAPDDDPFCAKSPNGTTT